MRSEACRCGHCLCSWGTCPRSSHVVSHTLMCPNYKPSFISHICYLNVLFHRSSQSLSSLENHFSHLYRHNHRLQSGHHDHRNGMKTNISWKVICHLMRRCREENGRGPFFQINQAEKKRPCSLFSV